MDAVASCGKVIGDFSPSVLHLTPSRRCVGMAAGEKLKINFSLTPSPRPTFVTIQDFVENFRKKKKIIFGRQRSFTVKKRS